jgi:hypothetical protein
MKQPDKDKARPYTIKTKDGGKASVTKKSVADAKSNSGAFAERPAYKGKEVTNKDGKLAGIKTNAGKYTATPGPVARKAGKKVLERDKAMHKQDSTSHSATIKAFQAGKKRK